MNFIELSKKIADLANRAGIKIDRLDMDITLSVAMNQEQVDDLAAMIDSLECSTGIYPPACILSNVMHDLNGLKAVYMELPEGDRFAPRSKGYSKQHV